MRRPLCVMVFYVSGSFLMRISNLFFLTLAAVGLASMSEAATVTYTYTGNNFTNFTPDTPLVPGSYDSSMRISGFVTLNAPLAPNLVASTSDADNVIASAVDFSFNDGRQTFDTADFGLVGAAVISFSTDALGTITGWKVQFDRRASATNLGDIAGGFGSDSSSFDAGTLGICASQPTCTNFPSEGFFVSTPGFWTVSKDGLTPVPLPAGLPLILTAMAGFGVVAKRKRSH